MRAIVEDAINALVGVGCFVETSGGKYTVARGGEIHLRQASAHDLLMFTRGAAMGFDAATEMTAAAVSIETALAQSPSHIAALQGKDAR